MIDLSAYGTETLKNAACIYKNPLQRPEDIRDFVLEGKAVFSFPNARLRMENQLDAASGQKANYVFGARRNFRLIYSCGGSFTRFRSRVCA